MNASQLPNPFTPMAFLPPELAAIRTNQLYAAIGSLAALAWDIGLHIPEDYELLTRYRINLSFIVYCISRLTSLAYLLGLAIIQLKPVDDCSLLHTIGLLQPFTTPFALLLFVFRIAALYNHNKYVTTFFFLSWLSVFGSSFLVPFGISTTHIGFTKYCVQIGMKPYIKFFMILTPVNDALVFLATSWAIFTNVYVEANIKNGFDVLVLGKHLPMFSRSFLQNGQAYYLVSLVFTIFVSATFFGHTSARIWSFLLALASFVVLNNMSCHIYRNTRLGHYKEYTVRTSVLERALGPFIPRLAHRQMTVESGESTETSIGMEMENIRQGAPSSYNSE